MHMEMESIINHNISNMVSNVSRTDVLIVAQKMRMTLTEEQVKKVMEIYNHEEECDPNGNWNEIVEHCIKQVL